MRRLLRRDARYRLGLFCCAVLFPLFFLSCVGVVSRITLNQNGSGTMQLEYRIARELESMGKLDGNERWLPIPVGRADLERTAERIPGLSLASYSVRQQGADTIHSAEFSFASLEALSAFFDSQGQQFVADTGGKRISLSFPEQKNRNSEFKSELTPEFQELVTGALEGYEFSFSLTVPGQASVVWLDKDGKTIQNILGSCLTRNNSVEYTIPMGQLVFLDASQTMEVRW